MCMCVQLWPERSQPAPAFPQTPHSLHHLGQRLTDELLWPWNMEVALRWQCLRPKNTHKHMFHIIYFTHATKNLFNFDTCNCFMTNNAYFWMFAKACWNCLIWGNPNPWTSFQLLHCDLPLALPNIFATPSHPLQLGSQALLFMHMTTHPHAGLQADLWHDWKEGDASLQPSTLGTHNLVWVRGLWEVRGATLVCCQGYWCYVRTLRERGRTNEDDKLL